MPQICLYFQLHQPYRLQRFNVFDLGKDASYFDDQINQDEATNQQIFQKVADKSYLPMLRLLRGLVQQQPEFKLAFSCSGVFIEQARQHQPEIIKLLQELAATNQVEFLAETYYHSLAFLYSEKEFIFQVKKHRQLVEQVFKQKPTTFRNTELIYSNYIGQLASQMGFSGVLTEAVDHLLQGREKTQVFASSGCQVPLLLKHALLSDDVAFRFSDKNWQWYPLQAEQYLDWIEVYGEDQLVNLFMDFETFGEHQWADTGIFEFFKSFVERFISKDWNQFVLPREVFTRYRHQHQPNHKISKHTSNNQKLSKYTSNNKNINKDIKALTNLPRYDVPNYISWADVDRDLTAWNGNSLQQDALRAVYELEEQVLASGNKSLIEDWRRLQTSDHFYYMCTKWSADGDVHAYFSPYQSPLEAYRRYSIVLADLKERLI